MAYFKTYPRRRRRSETLSVKRIKTVYPGKQPQRSISMCFCVRSPRRWFFYLIATICQVCSCFVHRDWKEDSAGQKTLHSAKNCASCCLESRFHLCSSLYSTSLAQEAGHDAKTQGRRLNNSLCLPDVSACMHSLVFRTRVEMTLFDSCQLFFSPPRSGRRFDSL